MKYLRKKKSKSQDTRSSLEKLKLRPFDIFWSTMLDVKRCPVHKIGIPAQITLISECWIGTKVLGNSHWIYPPSIFWFGLAPTLHHQLGRAEQSQWVFGNLFDLEQLFFPLFLGSFSRSWADRNLPVGCSKMQKKSYMIVCHLTRKFSKEKALTLSSKCGDAARFLFWKQNSYSSLIKNI